MGFGFVGTGAHRAGRAVLAAGGWVAVLLAGAALGAESERNVLFDPAFPVADDEVVSSKVANPDIAGQGHDDI